ncbi:RNA 2',3'-cyclic phosphodiesterase [Candidatus Neomarinimicrobiota bacterium]
MPPDTVRLFWGFALPKVIVPLAGNLRTLVDDPKEVVRWVHGRNIHLTVRFLGDTSLDAIDSIVAGVEDKLADQEPFMIRIEGTGVFPDPQRPRVLWLGVEEEYDSLITIEKLIHQALDPLGFPREEREFKPHVTIGRVRYPAKATPGVNNFLGTEYEPIICNLSSLILYESRIGKKGLEYAPIRTINFKSIG